MLDILRDQITEADLESKKETEEKRYAEVHGAVQTIIDELKLKQDWDKVSFEDIVRKRKLVSKFSDRKFFFFLLQSHPNIISKPAKASNLPDGIIAHTNPMEYKYVPEKVKIDMGFDAICYRKVQGSRKERLISILSNQPLKSYPWNILAVYEQYLTYEADKDWRFVDPLRVASVLGARINVVLDALADLERAHLMCFKQREITDHRRRRPGVNPHRIKAVCHLCWPETYEETKNKPCGDEQIDNAYLSRRDNVRSIEDNKKWIKTQVLKDAQEEQDKSDDERGISSLEDRIADFVKCEVRRAMDAREAQNSVIIEKLRSELLAEKSRKEEFQKKLQRSVADDTDLREKVQRLNAKLERERLVGEKAVAFNDSFIANAQDEMMIANGRISGVIEEFVKLAKTKSYELRDERVVNKYKGMIANIFGEMTSNITSYKEDKYPPAEKN